MSTPRRNEAENACFTELEPFIVGRTHRLGPEATEFVKGYIHAWFSLPEGAEPSEDVRNNFVYAFARVHRRLLSTVGVGTTSETCRSLLPHIDRVCKEHVTNFRQGVQQLRETLSSPRNSPSR